MTAQRDKGVKEWDKMLGQVDRPECNYDVSWGVCVVAALQCQIISTDWFIGSII